MSYQIPTPRTDAVAVPWTDVKPDTFYVSRVHARALESELVALADQLAAALMGCSQRLQITLADLNGTPAPEFDPPAPGRIDNIRAIHAALSAYERMKKGDTK